MGSCAAKEVQQVIVAKIVRILHSIEDVRELSPGTYVVQDKYKTIQSIQ